jgi:hypothetical protein
LEACLRHRVKASRALKKFDKVMTRGPKAFSWFIYRITTPAMRYLFMYDPARMNPRQDGQPPSSKMRRALISVLIGDVYRKNSYGWWLLMFKLTYYMLSFTNFRASFMAWRKRRRSIRIVEYGVTG